MKMEIQIEGDGAFGSFLRRELPFHGFQFKTAAQSVIMAVPLHAYQEVAARNQGKHLINVCSVQEPSTRILLRHTDKVTSLHPLFGARTPVDKRNSMLTFTHSDPKEERGSENTFLYLFKGFSNKL